MGESSKCLWKHKFVCLAYHDQTKIPTTDVEKDDLLCAGLGEKEIEFYNLEIGSDEFRELLYKHFRRLRMVEVFSSLSVLQILKIWNLVFNNIVLSCYEKQNR